VERLCWARGNSQKAPPTIQLYGKLRVQQRKLQQIMVSEQPNWELGAGA
jgi:hypothetical protein